MGNRIVVRARGELGHLEEPFTPTRQEPYKVTFFAGDAYVHGTDISLAPYYEAEEYEAELRERDWAAFVKKLEREHGVPAGSLVERFVSFDAALARSKELASKTQWTVAVQQCDGWYFVVEPEAATDRLYRLQQEAEVERFFASPDPDSMSTD